MDQELQKLIDEIQKEKCPPTVLSRVAQRIAGEKRPARSLRISVAWAVSIACLLTAATLWQWQNHREAKLIAAERAAAEVRAHRALVVQQTQEAFAYIGQALIRAAAST